MSKKHSQPHSLEVKLEITKLVVSTLTSICVVLLGFIFTTHQQENTTNRENATQVVKKRFEIWDKIAPKLNDIYCYYLYVGNWKELTPKNIIDEKRYLDKTIYTNLPFLSQDFVNHYNQFIDAAFETYSGQGKDAKLRTSALGHNFDEHDERFTGDDTRRELKQSFLDILKLQVKDLNIPRNDEICLDKQCLTSKETSHH